MRQVGVCVSLFVGLLLAISTAVAQEEIKARSLPDYGKPARQAPIVKPLQGGEPGGKDQSVVLATVHGIRIYDYDIWPDQSFIRGDTYPPELRPQIDSMRDGLLITKTTRPIYRQWLADNEIKVDEQDIEVVAEQVRKQQLELIDRDARELEALRRSKRPDLNKKQEKAWQKNYEAMELLAATRTKMYLPENAALLKESLRKEAIPIVQAWTWERAAWEKYGGSVFTGPFSTIARDARLRVLKDAETRGDLVIHDEQMRARYWKRLSEVPAGMTEVKDPKAFFETPPWRRAR